MHLDEVLPNLKNSGLSKTGFLFGAGTSFEAGYPLMAGLTHDVVHSLTADERDALDEVLAAQNLTYDVHKSEPNVEVISDHVISHAMSAQQPRFDALVMKLRERVTQAILGVQAPKLDRHVAFLEALKRRAFGQPACVYIVTTNYDVLFELAGAEAGVVIETGFVDSVERFFDPQRFVFSSGRRIKGSFDEHRGLTVRLIKLHGSVSWVARNGRFYERDPAAIASADRRVLILPRRRKVIDTLHSPHDALFSTARNALGTECKYLASCGFSFGDEHINDNLLLPVLSEGKAKLFALCEKETDGMASLKRLDAFSAGFSTGGLVGGTANEQGTDCWKFSKFIEMFG